MSQLIALIIAIALGAIVTAIGFVFLGDAFTKNSERGVALQFVSQASQVEMALTAHRAEKAASAYEVGNSAATPATTDIQETFSNLLVGGYLKDAVVAPFGDYELLKNGTKLYLVANSAEISDNVCFETLKLKDKNTSATEAPALDSVGADLTAKVVTSLGQDVYGCYQDTSSNVFAYRVE